MGPAASLLSARTPADLRDPFCTKKGWQMCTLRICGDDLDVDALLGHLTLEPASTYRRGEIWFKSTGRRHRTSGVSIGVSDADMANLAEQISDACAFTPTKDLRVV